MFNPSMGNSPSTLWPSTDQIAAEHLITEIIQIQLISSVFPLDNFMGKHKICTICAFRMLNNNNIASSLIFIAKFK